MADCGAPGGAGLYCDREQYHYGRHMATRGRFRWTWPRESEKSATNFHMAARQLPCIQLSVVDLGGITSPQAYRLLGEEVVNEAHVRAIRDTQRQARSVGCECSWTYCRSLYTVVRFVEAEARA